MIKNLPAEIQSFSSVTLKLLNDTPLDLLMFWWTDEPVLNFQIN